VLPKVEPNLLKLARPASNPEDMDFAQHMCDEAITLLVRNDGLMLPLQKAGMAANGGKN